MSPRRPPPDADLVERREILDEAGVARALRRIAYEVVERLTGARVYLGVRTGGAYLAERLARLVAEAGEGGATVGAVDITLYRDDVFHGLPKPEVGPTELPGCDLSIASAVLPPFRAATGTLESHARDVILAPLLGAPHA